VLSAGRQSSLHRDESRTRAVPASAEDLVIEIFRWRSFVGAVAKLWTGVEARPASVFIVLSLVFGIGISLIVPPLRGPDEIAHFLRIHSYARGALLPPAEVDGRKGIFVSSNLHAELSFYKDAGERFARKQEQGLRYGPLLAEHRPPGDALSVEDEQAGIFMPFAGTEGYNPAAYIPYILGASLADMMGLDFSASLLVMRLLGVVVFTAMVGFAIRIMPALKWAFVLIAMLPVALYNRSVLSADGAALASALVVTALCFSGTRWQRSAWERSLWMTLCTLAKQPQIVFLLLEGLVRGKAWRHGWGTMALVGLPSLILSPLWVVAVSADIAAWRLQISEIHPPEQFDPLWKLAYMWEHPLHFPWAAWNSVVIQGARLWQELIGILGWQDIVLGPSIYVCLTVLLLFVAIQKLHLDRWGRRRVALITGLVVVGYVILVYLIFFITYTPINIDHVRGVQGRYFVIILPVAALFVATTVNFALPHSVLAMAAVLGALLSGIVCFHALLDVHWLDP
jgi:Predicted membrane protein (DUF2142)